MASFRGLIATGARARLSIDGRKVALALDVSYGEEIPHEPVEPLDQFDVAEHVPIAYRASFSAQWALIIGNTIKNRDGVIILPKLEDILTRGEMTATIEDPSTGRVHANVQRVRCTGYNVRGAARALWITDAQFVCIRIKDSSEIV